MVELFQKANRNARHATGTRFGFTIGGFASLIET